MVARGACVTAGVDGGGGDAAHIACVWGRRTVGKGCRFAAVLN